MRIRGLEIHSRVAESHLTMYDSCVVQYSAASFVETINSGSLTMEPDEFLARMVEAGVTHLPSSPPDAPVARISSQSVPAALPSPPHNPNKGDLCVRLGSLLMVPHGIWSLCFVWLCNDCDVTRTISTAVLNTQLRWNLLRHYRSGGVGLGSGWGGGGGGGIWHAAQREHRESV